MKHKRLLLAGMCIIFAISPAQALRFEKLEGTEEAAEIFAMEPDIVSWANSFITDEKAYQGARFITAKDIDWNATYKQYECGNIFELGTDDADVILQYLAAECDYSWYLPVECSNGNALVFDFNKRYHPGNAMDAINEEPRKWSQGGISLIEDTPCLRKEFEAAVIANHLDTPNLRGVIVYADGGIRIGLIMNAKWVTHIIPLCRTVPIRYALDEGEFLEYPTSKDPNTVYFAQGKAYPFAEAAPVIAQLIPKEPEKKIPKALYLLFPAMLIIIGIAIYIKKRRAN